MELNIPKDRAIKILQKKIEELNSPNFDHKVWKQSVNDNLKNIFGLYDSKWLAVNGVDFYKPYAKEDELKKIVLEAKKRLKLLIESFIDQIEEYSDIHNDMIDKSEEAYKEKYLNLMEQTKVLVANHRQVINEQNELLDEIDEYRKTINVLQKNTVQLEDITLSKIWKLFCNLPISQVFTVVTTLIALITGSFFLGKTYTEDIVLSKSNKTEEKIISLNDEIKLLKEQNTELNSKLEDSLYQLSKGDKILKKPKELIVYNNTNKYMFFMYNNKVSGKGEGRPIPPNGHKTYILDGVVFNYRYSTYNIKNHKEIDTLKSGEIIMKSPKKHIVVMDVKASKVE